MCADPETSTVFRATYYTIDSILKVWVTDLYRYFHCRSDTCRNGLSVSDWVVRSCTTKTHIYRTIIRFSTIPLYNSLVAYLRRAIRILKFAVKLYRSMTTSYHNYSVLPVSFVTCCV